MTYTLNEVELANIEKYRKSLDIVFGSYRISKTTYCFTTTSSGTVVEVEFTMYCGAVYKYNVTDYASW